MKLIKERNIPILMDNAFNGIKDKLNRVLWSETREILRWSVTSIISEQVAVNIYNTIRDSK